MPISFAGNVSLVTLLAMRATIIAIANQKGGTGKTTTAVNLSAGLVQNGCKVVLIDMDPQAHSTSHLGVYEPDVTIEDVMATRCKARDATYETPLKNLFLIASTTSLSVYEAHITREVGNEFILRESLGSLTPYVDFILIDCPPSLDVLTVNALSAAHFVYIATQSEYFALDGVAKLHKTISTIQKRINPALQLGGIILTMHSKRMKHHVQAQRMLADSFPGQVCETSIRRNIKLADASSHGKPIQMYAPRSKGADDYNLLAKEVMKRCANVGA